jgi:hypothetical protein|tara:strand:- start:1432 stop:1656 length:225 start_codon:yes stop_codon:yes gene_type:complete
MAKFKKHMMYGDGSAKMADTNAEHLKLKKKGWGHKKPSGFKLKEVNSPMKCWKNYKQVGYKKKGGRTVPNCVPK